MDCSRALSIPDHIQYIYIYTSVFNLFNASSEYPIQAIALANDLIQKIKRIARRRIMWISGRQGYKKNCRTYSKRSNTYYRSWRLKINTSKSEIILFRPNLNYANNNIRQHYKTFAIKESKDSEIIILHKECVRYLGIYIDKKLKFNVHIDTQIAKARRAFLMYIRLFYSKYLHKKIKLICYQLLVRLIITYSYLIWCNISASQMEKVRTFERKVCLRMFANEKANFLKLHCNKIINNQADVSRIVL